MGLKRHWEMIRTALIKAGGKWDILEHFSINEAVKKWDG
jgi:hypothetical protein